MEHRVRKFVGKDAFAGQTVELRLTAYTSGNADPSWARIDDIQFSDVSIPKPNVTTLAALGAALVVRRLIRRSRSEN